MHVPKGKPIHQYLKTSYINLAALLADLQVNGFTGYLELTFPYACGRVFISSGAILNAVDEDGGRNRRGAEAIDAILLRASSPDGQVSVYTHSDEIIEAIAARIDGVAIYESLGSEFTDLKKLTEKLNNKQESRFYIEVEFETGNEGIIYTVDGDINAVVSLANGEIMEGEAGYARILSLVSEQEALFHVYRCSNSPVSAVALAAEGRQANVIAFPEPISVPVDDAILDAELEDETVTDEIPDADIDASEPVNNEAEIVVDFTVDYTAEYEILIALMGEVTQVVERAVTRLAREGNFAAALRSGLLEVTDEYPYFDPFAAEFEYRDGKIRLSAVPPPADFIAGLTRALKGAVRELERMVPAVGLRQVIADALSKLQQLRSNEFARFDLSPALAEIVAAD
jgi:hypothetical protein